MTASAIRGRVWIVDDSRLETERGRARLADDYAVETFVDGATMLEQLAHGAPDVLLVDWEMPVVSGLELCRFLREQYDEVTLPILMLTSRAAREDVAAGLVAGANDYLAKPWDDAELRARVRSLWRIGRQAKAISQREQWLSTTLNSIGDGVITTDVDGRVVFMNAVAERLTGWRQGEATTRPFTEVCLIVDDAGLPARSPVTDALSRSANPAASALDHGPTDATIVHRSTSGSDERRTPIECTAAPIRAGEDVVGVVFVFRDIIERSRHAAAYEVERKKAEALAEKAESLAESDRTKTAFFSNVSHEFRTPLTLILAPLEDELAERASPLPPERRQRLETAHRNAERLLKLVNTLLDFSRVEAGRAQASYEPRDLATDTAELASVFRSAVESAGLALSIDCPPLPEPVFVDREMWEKVIFNLLSNALKHTFKGGITVSVKSNDDDVTLLVSDTGIGIGADELPRLFDRFHRVKGARSRSHEGTGIGLALVQELVRLHGGVVAVQSQQDVGTTFTVSLKTGRAHLPDESIAAQTSSSSSARIAGFIDEARACLPAAPAPSGPERATERGKTARPRILWADDNADMREYVRRLLDERYDVIAVPDGLTALAAAREQHPELVLTDVMMPGLDGFGLLRELRADPLTKTIPVILLSARAGEETVLAGLDSGADDYICKPFSARELLSRVRTHLELSRARRAWTTQLERANAELEQFAYIASHDLQEPLRMVRSYVQLLEKEYKGQLQGDADKYIHFVVDGTTRMQALINDLLSLSRLNSQARPSVPTESGKVLKTALADLQASVTASGAVVTSDALPVVVVDGNQLRLVFQNLIGNAIKFQQPGEVARVHVSAEPGDAEWTFSVRDSGIGIEPKHAERVFRMFQRLHTRAEYPGTGIGLAVCKKIVERAGGRIWVDSNSDSGVTFHFTLPVARSDDQ